MSSTRGSSGSPTSAPRPTPSPRGRSPSRGWPSTSTIPDASPRPTACSRRWRRGSHDRDPGPSPRRGIAGARASRAAVTLDLLAVESYTRASLLAYERAGDLRNVCTQATVLGIAEERAGRYADAERVLLKAIDLAQRFRLPMGMGMTLASLARVHFVLGDRARGMQEAREAIDWLSATEHTRLAAIAWCGLAWMLFETDDLDGAGAAAATAYDVGDFAAVARQHSLALRARILLRRGELDGARSLSDEAAAVGGDDRAIFDSEALSDLARIEVRLAHGDTEAAREFAAAAWGRLVKVSLSFGEAAARRAFLERVPLHAEVGAVCDRLGVPRGEFGGTVHAKAAP